MEQNHGGKNDKRTKNNPSQQGHYAESNAVAIKAIYYGINMKTRMNIKKPKKKEKSLKINNQWRDKIKQSDFIKENRKKLKKLIKKMVIK